VAIILSLVPFSPGKVDLHFLTVLTAIATQGAISRETQNGYYVRTYKLEVSTNGEDWMMYRHGKNHKVKAFLSLLHAPQRDLQLMGGNRTERFYEPGGFNL